MLRKPCVFADWLDSGRSSSNIRAPSLFPCAHLFVLFLLALKDDAVAKIFETIHEGVQVLLDFAEAAKVPESLDSVRNMLESLVGWSHERWMQGLARVLWMK